MNSVRFLFRRRYYSLADDSVKIPNEFERRSLSKASAVQVSLSLLCKVSRNFSLRSFDFSLLGYFILNFESTLRSKRVLDRSLLLKKEKKKKRERGGKKGERTVKRKREKKKRNHRTERIYRTMCPHFPMPRFRVAS